MIIRCVNYQIQTLDKNPRKGIRFYFSMYKVIGKSNDNREEKRHHISPNVVYECCDNCKRKFLTGKIVKLKMIKPI